MENIAFVVEAISPIRASPIKLRYTSPEVEGPTVAGERDQHGDLQADRDCRKRS